jgi:hypothetical protein
MNRREGADERAAGGGDIERYAVDGELTVNMRRHGKQCRRHLEMKSVAAVLVLCAIKLTSPYERCAVLRFSEIRGRC